MEKRGNCTETVDGIIIKLIKEKKMIQNKLHKKKIFIQKRRHRLLTFNKFQPYIDINAKRKMESKREKKKGK